MTVRRISALDVVGIAVLCGSAALAALVELLLVPLYDGATLVPVTVLLTVGTNAILPRMARTFVDSTPAALLPFASWLVVAVGFGLMPRPEGDVILPGGGGGVEWVSYGVLLGGALTGTVSVVLSGLGRPVAGREPGLDARISR